MQSSVLCGVRVHMMERRPLVAIGRKDTDRIRPQAPRPQEADSSPSPLPPQGAASRRSPDSTVQEGGGAEAEQGEGRRARFMCKWRDR